eukprot:4960063-Pleurochrysis_carterae.AAC.1
MPAGIKKQTYGNTRSEAERRQSFAHSQRLVMLTCHVGSSTRDDDTTESVIQIRQISSSGLAHPEKTNEDEISGGGGGGGVASGTRTRCHGQRRASACPTMHQPPASEDIGDTRARRAVGDGGTAHLLPKTWQAVSKIEATAEEGAYILTN